MSEKVCAVCGDNAIAKNFNVITCQACKPFFRRNANKANILRCDYGGNCEITIETRSKCRKCRLDKCLAVGMSKDLILTDQERYVRKVRAHINRQKKSQLINQKNANSVLEPSNESNHAISDEEITEFEEFIRINEIIMNSYKLSIDKSLVSRPINCSNNEFNQFEDFKLLELFQVLRNLEIKINDNSYKITTGKNKQEIVHHADLFYEYHTKKLIETIKMMNSFDQINDNDRLILVKHSSVEILILRGVFRYNIRDETWKYPTHNDNLSEFKMQYFLMFSRDCYPVYKNTWHCIFKECDSDYVIINLLTAIALFNSNRPNIANREAIDCQQRVYMHLLQRYLQMKYRSHTQSEQMFGQLLNTLTFAHIIGQLEKRYFFGPNYEMCGPIVRELFDINNTLMV